VYTGGKIMHIIKSLKIIPLVFGFIAVTFGCATSKNQVSVLADVKFSAEIVPEGILVTFNHIPQEINQLNISFRDWGGEAEPDWDNIDALTGMNLVRDMLETWIVGLVDTDLDQFRQTRKVILPFVQTGHRYIITAYFVNNGELMRKISTECVADKGIFFDTNISLALNDTHTGVTLSNEPKFTSDIQYGPDKMWYSVSVQGENYNTAVGDYTDNLFWDFEPKLTDQLKEDGAVNGNYTAFAQVTCNIIYDNVSWYLEIAKTPLFTYSF
jgi:hypothetical protein